MRFLLLCLTVFFLASFSSAAEVALVVTLPNNYSYIKCVNVPGNADGLDLISKADIEVGWEYDSLRGHYPVRILGHECPQDGCVLHILREGVWFREDGFDCGLSCSLHYCAREGDIAALGYGGTPPDFEFREICRGKAPSTAGGLTGNVVASGIGDNQIIASLVLITLLVVYFVYRYW
ncbi:MAG: hypothetical protein U9M95_02720 [Candidatus Altiarchaeota archaeon]|nr:hypothetical protein [Candidatus Altiarchaeota archaeon]